MNECVSVRVKSTFIMPVLSDKMAQRSDRNGKIYDAFSEIHSACK